jgi:hypothetical protein
MHDLKGDERKAVNRDGLKRSKKDLSGMNNQH